MNDRAQAISILKQARDILAERITERIIESKSDILEDAHGYSYMSEIDSISDQLGGRLISVSQMLANLPVQLDPEENQPPLSADQYPTEAPSEATLGEVSASDDPSNESAGSGYASEGNSADSKGTPTFQTFAMQIQAGDLEAASHSLVFLFEVDQPRALQCAKVFYDMLREDPQSILRAMQIRKELVMGNFNSAMMLLYQCFGLQGMESIGVAQTLKVRFATGD